MSEETLKPFPESYNEIQLLKKPGYVSNLENKGKELEKKWNINLLKKDEGAVSKNNWVSNATNTSDWSETIIPGLWNGTSLNKINGVVWYKKEIEISKKIASNESILRLGSIMGGDSTYVNGKSVGNAKDEWASRKYQLPANTSIEGKHYITVRIVNNRGNGGFTPGLAYKIIGKEESIDLTGIWKYKLGAKLDPLPNPVNFDWKPIGLYNAMIEPLKNYNFKGTIWYQGEANARRPKEYAKILSALITNWRALFNNSSMPFLFVQLPNFMAVKDFPSESNWALLRESQLKTASLPYTGMATTIELGEWDNIHPKKKKEVVTRLALVAQKVAYNNSNVMYSGPKYESMQI
jgi:sialate O-acetylesterase